MQPIQANSIQLTFQSTSEKKNQSFTSRLYSRCENITYSGFLPYKFWMAILIEFQAKELIDRWKKLAIKNKSFDLTKETRRFKTNVICEALLGGIEQSNELSDAIHFINHYIFTRALRKYEELDENEFKKGCQIFNQKVSAILEVDKKKALPLFQNNKNDFLLTLAQKQALVFVLFFAGQETLSFVKDHLIAKLARDPLDQNRLFNSLQDREQQSKDEKKLYKIDALQQLIDKRLLEIPPVYGLSRKIKKNTILSFKTTDQKQFSKLLRKAERVFPVIDSGFK